MVMELRNQNGEIVGIDADGNVVPVEFGSVSSERAEITERWDFEAGYHVEPQKVAETSDYLMEPRLTRLNNDDGLIVYRRGDNHAEDSTGITVAKKWTDWSDISGSISSQATVYDGTDDTRNACIINERGTDPVAVLMRVGSVGLYIARSTDFAETWTVSDVSSSFNQIAPPFIGDAVETSQGMLTGTNESSGIIESAITTDHGQSFSDRVTIHDNGANGTSYTEACPVVLDESGDNVLLVGRDLDSGKNWAVKSSDGGLTWGSLITGFDISGAYSDVNNEHEPVNLIRVNKGEVVIAWGDRTSGEIRTASVGAQALWDDPAATLNRLSYGVVYQSHANNLQDFGYANQLPLGSGRESVLTAWYDGDDPDIWVSTPPQMTARQDVQLKSNSIGSHAETTQDVTLADNSSTTVEFHSNNYNDRDEFDYGNNEFVAAYPGRYNIKFYGRVNDAGSSGEEYQPRVYINGDFVKTAHNYSTGSGNARVSIDTTLPLDVGDSVQLRIYQNTGGSRTLNGDSRTTYLMITQQR